MIKATNSQILDANDEYNVIHDDLDTEVTISNEKWPARHSPWQSGDHRQWPSPCLSQAFWTKNLFYSVKVKSWGRDADDDGGDVDNDGGDILPNA